MARADSDRSPQWATLAVLIEYASRVLKSRAAAEAWLIAQFASGKVQWRATTVVHRHVDIPYDGIWRADDLVADFADNTATGTLLGLEPPTLVGGIEGDFARVQGIAAGVKAGGCGVASDRAGVGRGRVAINRTAAAAAIGAAAVGKPGW
jgi:hypothetical protein